MNQKTVNKASEKSSSKPATQSTQGTDHLKRVLADTFVLYMKTYAVHWNYTGSKFFSVHKLTEEHYKELAEAIDEIAERIRAKGEDAPISLADILGASDLRELQDDNSAGSDRALRELIASHELLARRTKEAADALEDDDYSNDMMIGRIGAHQKAAWMLKSFLQGSTPTQH